MISLLIALLAFVVFLVSLRMNYARLRENNTSWLGQRLFWKVITLPVIILLFSFINPFRLERVDSGRVGIKVNLIGDNRGISSYEYKTGWVVYNSWSSQLYEFPTFQQHIEYPDQVVITKGGFEATIMPTFNYSLVPGNIGDMFQNLRIPIKEVEQGWLKTAIVGSVNDVANKWEVDSIFNNREKFEHAIAAECNKRISQWFTVSQLRTNILPPKAITESINAKTKAIQDVQVAQNNERVAVAEANRKMAVARGDSAQLVINAAGEAEAIRRRQIVLTPEYIEFLKVTKWNGQNSQVVTGNGGGVLVNLGKQ